MFVRLYMLRLLRKEVAKLGHVTVMPKTEIAKIRNRKSTYMAHLPKLLYYSTPAQVFTSKLCFFCSQRHRLFLTVGFSSEPSDSPLSSSSLIVIRISNLDFLSKHLLTASSLMKKQLCSSKMEDSSLSSV